MPIASVTTVDSAGGIILPSHNNFVTYNGKLYAVVGDLVTNHGIAPHSSATMETGSSFVTINGIWLCRQGDIASCGHAATGSSFLNVSN